MHAHQSQSKALKANLPVSITHAQSFLTPCSLLATARMRKPKKTACELKSSILEIVNRYIEPILARVMELNLLGIRNIPAACLTRLFISSGK